jgi:small subunit ribosomal protein S1
VSELGAGRRVTHPREIVKPGQAVEVSVVRLELDKRRIGLSMAGPAPGEDPEEVAAVAAARRDAEGQRFGTLGDLLRASKKDK